MDCVAQTQAALPRLKIVAPADKGPSTYWLGKSYADVRPLFAVKYPDAVRVYYERPDEKCNSSLFAESGGGDELRGPEPKGEIIVGTGSASKGLLRNASGRALVKSEGRKTMVSGHSAVFIVREGLIVLINGTEVGVTAREGKTPADVAAVMAALTRR